MSFSKPPVRSKSVRHNTISDVSRYVKIDITGDITDETAKNVCHALEVAKAVKQPIVVVRIHSTGGSVPAGKLIQNHLAEYKKMHNGNTVVTYVSVQAFSMAAIIFLCGDRRVMASSAKLMLHRVSVQEASGGSKDVHMIQSINDYRVDLNTELFKFIVETSKSALTLETLEERTPGIDWYINSAEAIKYNLATEVSDTQPRLLATVACDVRTYNNSH
ncbi:hypothetical protein CYMTET_35737 [Cymbomonas tetramitiformis]|uniref:ATP-dependent Clp protease proteolytic subunit n=1 Tax=Cymbomonas tetramitiformis TaxID=36881 RepID=A0AAE0KNU7_9CHLO|nr:hypothetical protein CYMTET_35737 [Cymbomonas tetramitiformis]|eukprot:gene180-315_t